MAERAWPAVPDTAAITSSPGGCTAAASAPPRRAGSTRNPPTRTRVAPPSARAYEGDAHLAAAGAHR